MQNFFGRDGHARSVNHLKTGGEYVDIMFGQSSKGPELTDRATHEFFQAIILSTPAVPWGPRDEGFSRGFERGAAMVGLVGFI